MLKRLAIYILGATLASGFIGCNSSSSVDAEYVYGNTMVTAFSLEANDDVLNNLDTVFFSIDLVNAQIFNADSLPYGTDVSRLVVNISTNYCSTVELKVPQSDGTTTTIDYLTNSTDSIDFTKGPVTLHVVSYDSKAERDYSVSVNVHKMVPDSLYWDRLAMRDLPTTLKNPTAQKAVSFDGYAICLTTDGSDYCVASSHDPYNNEWEYSSIALSFNPIVSTMTSTDSSIYMLADDGELFSSTDYCQTWQSTGETWYNIIGSHQQQLLGIEKVGSTYNRVTYPASMSSTVPDEFPIAQIGSTASINNQWATSPQTILVGGKKADGSLSKAVWGYDGNNWARLSKDFPVKIADASFFPYSVIETDTVAWQTTQYPVLVAMLGVTEDGTTQKNVYISKDNGMNWNLGDDLVQLPSYIPAMSDATPLIFSTYFFENSRSASAWREYAPLPLPGWWSIDAGLPQSRATEPVTEWITPFVYLFGGYDDAGNLYNTVWRGVLNYLTFKPLQ